MTSALLGVRACLTAHALKASVHAAPCCSLHQQKPLVEALVHRPKRQPAKPEAVHSRHALEADEWKSVRMASLWRLVLAFDVGKGGIHQEGVNTRLFRQASPRLSGRRCRTGLSPAVTNPAMVLLFCTPPITQPNLTFPASRYIFSIEAIEDSE